MVIARFGLVCCGRRLVSALENFLSWIRGGGLQRNMGVVYAVCQVGVCTGSHRCLCIRVEVERREMCLPAL